MKNLSVQVSHQERQSNNSIPLIDVRTPAEFGSVHANGAINHPMESFDLSRLSFSKTQEVHVICQSGGRSMKVCQKLEGAGFTKIANVEGGTSAWQSAGLPVVEGKKVMSLERQVRIAAGALIVIGSVVGHFYNPAGYGLSAFVGAGLVFAGVTDTCGMGMIIAKMPWNRA
ncbi:rhodanese-like domain-containing protein [Opitutales bacterium]|jgi:rhodanese-related sulfurtransferase|nr:rhodanese-like domain-containing protein [Opitutales bacterium]